MALAEGVYSAAAGIANLFGAGGRGGEREEREALALWQALQDPNFDWSELTPAQLQFISEVAPEVYDAVVPEGAATAAEGATRADQMRSLGYLQQVQREGMPLADRLAAQQATDAVAAEAGRAQEAVLRSLAERGRLSGGNELQARLLASQGTGQLAADMGVGLAQDAINRRYGAALDAGGLASGIRSQDEALAAENAAMINRFNEMAANLQTDAARYAADARNQASFRNQAERQRIADTNALLRQETQASNLDRRNALASALAGFQFDKTAAQTGQLGNLATRMDARRAAREQNIYNIGRGWGQAVDSALGMALGGPGGGLGGKGGF